MIRSLLGPALAAAASTALAAPHGQGPSEELLKQQQMQACAHDQQLLASYARIDLQQRAAVAALTAARKSGDAAAIKHATEVLAVAQANELGYEKLLAKSTSDYEAVVARSARRYCALGRRPF